MRIVGDIRKTRASGAAPCGSVLEMLVSGRSIPGIASRPGQPVQPIVELGRCRLTARPCSWYDLALEGSTLPCRCSHQAPEVTASVLDVTDRDIAALGDEDLRALVAQLCKATLKWSGLPSSAVTSGGHQDAPDGGIDVRVDLAPDTAVSGYVPRPATGLQVKKPDMQPAAIKAEMRPGGQLRPVIQDLAARGGAYVIVSSGASLPDAAYRGRCAAMRQALADLPSAGQLATDFYDRRRLATWIADYPGLAAWVRAKAGRPMQGWMSYGAWAFSPEGEAAEYLLGNEVRLHSVQDGKNQELSAADGLEALRALLRAPGKAVRLVGLSGVGKTRLVQALFDTRIGSEALDTSLALYADLGDTPDPPPVAVATSLIAQRTHAVLIVDNCAADLHRRLSALALAAGSTISVVTVEYDVADDQPEGTEVFRLEPASAEVVGQLLRLRFPGLPQVNVDIIAENSGGNARIAIALAQTVGKGESLAGLSDRDLFLRLFQQRHPHDPSLLAAAEACALVYSFDGEMLTGDETELPRLAALAGLPSREIYRHTGELVRRGLVQSRSKWRAVLPLAIANRLAEGALENIPWQDIETQLVRTAPDRLARSFSRRLGHLHRSAAAVRIAESWLAPAGLLTDVANLSPLGQAMFTNIAPLAPAAVLTALERAAEGPDGASVFVNMGSSLTRLLRSLAFDAALFERSAALLIRAALAEDPDNKVNSVADVFSSLFSILLSGTHATVEQRVRMIDGLLRSEGARRQGLGLKALGAALEASHFSSVYGFGFGARLRDNGHEPRTKADVLQWFSAFIELCRELGCSGLPVAQRVRAHLAQHFHGLWHVAGAHDALRDVAHAFSRSGRWDEGWMAVRQVLGLERDGLEAHERERLQALNALLAPRSLAERVNIYVLSRKSSLYDALEDEDGEGTPASIAQAMTQARTSIEGLGSEVAGDDGLFVRLLPDLVRHRDDVTPLWDFGRGLARAAADPEAIWQALAEALRLTPEASANPVVLKGFLDGLHARDAERVDALLDGAVQHEALARWFPSLQSAVALDRAGLERLHRSLQFGTAQMWTYLNLRYCTLAADISERELAGLVEAIAARQDGTAVALEILAARLHLDRNGGTQHPALVVTGRRLLGALAPGGLSKQKGRMLVELVAACTTGPEGEAVAEHLWQLIADYVAAPDFDHGLGEIMKALFKTQPDIALTAFLKQIGPRRDGLGWSLVEGMEAFGRNPLNEVAPDVVLAWCDHDPAVNYPLAAASVQFEGAAQETGRSSWNATAVQLMDRAPDRLAVLQRFVERFTPRSWSGSRAAIFSRRAQLLDVFVQDRDQGLAGYARSARDKLEREAEQERGWEANRSREQDERFE